MDIYNVNDENIKRASEMAIREYVIEGNKPLKALRLDDILYFELTDSMFLLAVHLSVDDVLNELRTGAVKFIHGRWYINAEYIDNLMYLSSDTSFEIERAFARYMEYIRKDFEICEK